jgi:signal transduction histidine kinase
VFTGSVNRSGRIRPSASGAFVVGAVGAAGVVAAAVTGWTAARSPVLVDPSQAAAWRAAIVASYWAVGAYTWWRRPVSRLGPIITALGFLYAASTLVASGVPLVHTLGMVVWALALVWTAYLYLCFPRGRLESRLERGLILVVALSMALTWGLILALSPRLPPGGSLVDCGMRCPPNAVQLVSGHAATGQALTTVFRVVLMVAAIGIAILILTKARSSSHLRRRAIVPLAAVFVANVVEFVIALFLAPADPGAREGLRIAVGGLTLAIPVAILVGQVRGNVFAAISLGQVAVRASGKPLTPASVQGVIGDALGDPSLALALWAPERAGYVDVHGAPLTLPQDSRARGITRVTRNDRPVAALIHDPTLDTDSSVIEGLAATSLMLLENSRLVDELRASRSRIVDAAERERRRLERDLHDGAQQRLVAIQVRLGLAQQLADGDELARQLQAAQREAEAALAELRALAHGIYPAELHDFGPAFALRSLARGAPVPVEVTDEGVGRSAEAIEAALYFCAREAIQNAAKHAGADAEVAVRLARRADAIELTVSDDGAGMAFQKHGDGIGITGMRDRIEAVGGEFEIVSTPGRGTSIHATVIARDRSQPRGPKKATELRHPVGTGSSAGRRPGHVEPLGGFVTPTLRSGKVARGRSDAP